MRRLRTLLESLLAELDAGEGRSPEASAPELLDRLRREEGRRAREAERWEEALAAARAEVERLRRELEGERALVPLEAEPPAPPSGFIGRSPALREVFARMDAVAGQDTTVLILGETGTGKGLLARALHERSPRRERPLVFVNCTALPANLIESELFGREKGAFTGASAQQIGRFELADKGTLFLDEVGDLPLELQAKLLHVLQEKEFCRLGSPRPIRVDVRILAATNRDLQEEMARGRFREDLFYRLNIFPILLPPLRQRREDIPLLAESFVRRFSRAAGREIRHVPAGTLERLVAYGWPGNVRELENVIERAVLTSPGDTLRVQDRLEPAQALDGLPFPTLAQVEREHLRRALERAGGRIDGPGGAAELLDLNPSTLRGRLRKAGVRPSGLRA
ncbi:MAG TPA: sigma 54-interacting transcriptional regulator [Holophaga sp.]|nr:sigma 54-interacting transcriptional regulator [Holophaga sp.]